MAEYRIYTVGSDGHFIGFTPLFCEDDAQAIQKAEQLLDGHDLQLWSGPRYVGRLKSKDKSE
jgi:hypothetical protein